jgi:hypothetical protein
MSILQKYKKLQKKLQNERKFKQFVLVKYEFGVWLRQQNKKTIHQNLGTPEEIEYKIAEVKIVTSQLSNMLTHIKKSKQRIRSIQNEMSQLVK